MHAAFDDVVTFIGDKTLRSRQVVEVGAGSGQLARLIARTAKHVLLFEPSVALSRSLVPEANIEIINDYFSASRLASPVDLVICRQVLEHVESPAGFFQDLSNALKPDAILYLEVPSAEFIEEKKCIFDFHYAHVQYFHKSGIEFLAAAAGFSLEKSTSIKEGHDTAFLFRKTGSRVKLTKKPITGGFDAGWIELKRIGLREQLVKLPQPLAIYGATAHGQSFISFFDTDIRIETAFDDTPGNWDSFMYSCNQVVPVRNFSQTANHPETIIITAYLHDSVIRKKLYEAGFQGTVFSIKP